MATHGDIGVSQPAASTITMKVRTVTLDLNSTVVHQEILTLGGAESSLEVARVLGASPASTDMGLVVRPVGYSTVVTVARMVGNSSAADYLPVRIVDSSGTGYLAPGLEYTDGSTTSTLAAPGVAYRNSSNDTMRVVGVTTPLPVQVIKSYPTRASVVSTVTSTASSAFYEVVSSAAGVAKCVYAYSVTSTAVTPMAVEFFSGTNTALWGLDVGSASSGVTGANLAVTPPGALFQTASAANLTVRLGSTGVQVRIAVASFSE